ncbi:MAG: hypothetical protein HRT35_09645 [Algicola sp.]|nr:hypothetical protein [Algicola sp.]
MTPFFFSRSIVNSATGWGDTVSFGLSGYLRKKLGIGGINTESRAYTNGGYAGFVTGFGGALKSGLMYLGTRAMRSRVFWSGGAGIRAAAQAHATRQGALTLEMTLTGKAITWSAPFIGEKATRALWIRSSQSFAKGAKGSVDVIHSRQGIALTSVWRTEYEILKQNGVGLNFIVK